MGYGAKQIGQPSAFSQAKIVRVSHPACARLVRLFEWFFFFRPIFHLFTSLFTSYIWASHQAMRPMDIQRYNLDALARLVSQSLRLWNYYILQSIVGFKPSRCYLRKLLSIVVSGTVILLYRYSESIGVYFPKRYWSYCFSRFGYLEFHILFLIKYCLIF